jgi:hypothetical protein
MSTDDILAKLDELSRRPKYVDEPNMLYFGMGSERDRRLAEAQFNCPLLDLKARIGA